MVSDDETLRTALINLYTAGARLRDAADALLAAEDVRAELVQHMAAETRAITKGMASELAKRGIALTTPVKRDRVGPVKPPAV